MGQTKQEHLKDLLDSFDTAMLITRNGEKLHARPMTIAQHEGASTLWFVASDRSPKARELDDPRVSATLQSKSRFVALSGKAKIVRDPAKIQQLWSPAWKVWFPDGKDDPSLVLIRLDVEDAEFWDDAGMRGVRYAVNAVKGLIRGETPVETDDNHGRLKHTETSANVSMKN